ncbi:hypothetical protein GPY51_10995 [Photorhabdus laumondii subsp. laumondii]|uniref:Uncharacterized protein n=1 Tax=Photorhabdus laumondii subsp. laumondii TaxID=141679 RepID=A0A6L9JRM9_PHOLM|nr:hypothetical protein [Photorhabdus laumondii]AWK42616.1 hypothetical protein A4R40_14510 [Photorhabdus laumondii subsp. laumondii]AXG47941.1 hypothetical protein PluTT01m_14930 [Photorhabdus laumondii subsp. laumondii]MCC8384597.1 hypothetical protein [Photorhabdus laumondii]MCC8413357.1 hypothetical protein [Photorhabdus laumondii]NDK95022.1 hypothetical protein [Photorhabdus laumondii subsp. laumondii]
MENKENSTVIFAGKEVEQEHLYHLLEVIAPAVCEVAIHHAKNGEDTEIVTKHAKATAEAIVSALTFTKS